MSKVSERERAIHDQATLVPDQRGEKLRRMLSEKETLDRIPIARFTLATRVIPTRHQRAALLGKCGLAPASERE